MPVLVPLVRQAYDYSCGPASLASILYYWGVWEGREPQLYDLCQTTSEYGTPGYGLMEVASSFGLSVQYRYDLTLSQLQQLEHDGYTIILSIQAWTDLPPGSSLAQVWEDGHYVVFVGLVGDTVYLMDPAMAGRYRTMSVAELMDCWHDWNDEDEHEYFGAILIRGDRAINNNLPKSFQF